MPSKKHRDSEDSQISPPQTAPEDMPIEDLRRDHDKYKNQLDNLSDEVSKMMRQRNRPQRKKMVDISSEVQALMKKNESLRKERLRLYGEATHSDTAQKIAETRNQIGSVNKQIEQKQSEIKGLENVRRNQEGLVELARHTESEMRYLQDEHRQEMNEFRVKYHELTQEYKKDERELNALQAKMHNALERLKVDMDGTRWSELQQTVSSQEEELEKLKTQVGEVKAQSEGQARKDARKIVGAERDIQGLRKRVTYLEDMLKQRDVELKRSYANTKV